MHRFSASVFAVLVLLPHWSQSEILFHSDFECGETVTKAKVLSKQQEIRLFPNYRLEEWPLINGQGLIEANFPERSEAFSYKERTGAVLKGVTGIQKPHPAGTPIQTGNLLERSPGGGILWVGAAPEVKISRRSALFGKHSARFRIEPLHRVNSLAAFFDLDSPILYVRLYVQFAPDLFENLAFNVPFLSVVLDSCVFPKLTARKDNQRTRPRFSLTKLDNNIVEENELFGHNAFVAPNRAYCIECRYEILDSNHALLEINRDGAPMIKQRIRYARDGQGASELPVVRIGIVQTHTRDLKGSFLIDEVIVADSPIGRRPPKPSIRLTHHALQATGMDPASGLPLVAGHWQIAHDNAWFLPIYSSGEYRDGIAELPLPFRTIVPPNTGHPIRIPHDLVLPTQLRPGQWVYARLRQKARMGIWSEWSDPVHFRTPSGKPLRPVTKDLPEMKDAFFAHIGEREPLPVLQRNKWYDFYVFPRDPRGWESLNHVDVYLSNDPVQALASHHNRGGDFNPKSNYVISLPLDRHGTYLKLEESNTELQRVDCGKVSFYDNTECNYLVHNPREGWIRCRLRFPEQSLWGPWLLTGICGSRDGRLSAPFGKIVHVVNDQGTGSSERRDYLKWLVVLAVFVAGMAIQAMASRRRRKQAHSPGPPDQDREEESLRKELDSLKSATNENIQKVQGFVMENYQRNIGVNEIAETINVSANWLSKLFAKETGETLTQFMNRVRIFKSKEMLRQTSTRVSEIAFKCGFNSLDHFLRVFRGQEGTTPGNYRKEHRKT